MTLLDTIITLATENKADHIAVYDVSPESTICDQIIVMSVTNTVHCQSLSLLLDKAITQYTNIHNDDDYIHPQLSGNAKSGWIILDVNSIIVHIMINTTREFYQLDKFLESYGIIYHY